MEVLYLSDNRQRPDVFQTLAKDVAIVCMGDSITGYNNHLGGGPPTYPRYLQELVSAQVVDCGIAGEHSGQGLEHLPECLRLFPAARLYVIGYGTNDLEWGPARSASRAIIENLGAMNRMLAEQGKQAVFVDLPGVCAKESGWSKEQLAYHDEKVRTFNKALRLWCRKNNAPLAQVHGKVGQDDFIDIVHPSESGSRVIADIVAKALPDGYRVA